MQVCKIRRKHKSDDQLDIGGDQRCEKIVGMVKLHRRGHDAREEHAKDRHACVPQRAAAHHGEGRCRQKIAQPDHDWRIAAANAVSRQLVDACLRQHGIGAEPARKIVEVDQPFKIDGAVVNAPRFCVGHILLRLDGDDDDIWQRVHINAFEPIGTQHMNDAFLHTIDLGAVLHERGAEHHSQL